MKRLLAITSALLAVAPAAAAGKGVIKAEACGADECRTLSRADTRGLEEGGPPSDPPAKAAAFYKFNLTVGTDGGNSDTFSVVYVPSARMIQGPGGTWMAAPASVVERFDRAVKGLQAFPASKLTGLETRVPVYEAQVSEVVSPPAGTAAADNEAKFPWVALAGGLLAIALLAAITAWTVRRRRPPGTAAART